MNFFNKVYRCLKYEFARQDRIDKSRARAFRSMGLDAPLRRQNETDSQYLARTNAHRRIANELEDVVMRLGFGTELISSELTIYNQDEMNQLSPFLDRYRSEVM